MSCQLIRVNFRRQEVLSRTQLDEDDYDPSKCAVFQTLMDQAKEIARDAYQNNVNPKRMIILVSDPLNAYNFASFDSGTLDLISAMDTLEYTAMRFNQALRDDLEF